MLDRINTLIEDLRKVEAEQKTRYYSAVDIEDIEEAKTIAIDAQTKMRQIWKWIGDLLRLKQEMIDTFPIATKDIQSDDPQGLSQDLAATVPVENGCTKPSLDEGIGDSTEGIHEDALSQQGANCEEAEVTIAATENPECKSPGEIDEIFKDAIKNTPSEPEDFISTLFSEDNEITSSHAEDEEDNVAEDTSCQLQLTASREENTEHPQFILLGKTYVGGDWQELLVILCEAMIIIKPYKMVKLGTEDTLTNGADYASFSFDKSNIKQNHQKLSNGLFVETGGSDADIKLLCEHLKCVVAEEQVADVTAFVPVSDVHEKTEAVIERQCQLSPQTGDDEMRNIDTSTKPSEFWLLGKNYIVESCQELLITLCEAMILIKPYKMVELVANSCEGFSFNEHHNQREYKKLSNRSFVETGGSYSDIKIRCECILEACNIDRRELQIY